MLIEDGLVRTLYWQAATAAWKANCTAGQNMRSAVRVCPWQRPYTSNCRMASESWTGKDVKGSGCSTLWRNTQKTKTCQFIVRAGRDLNPESLFTGPPETLEEILWGVSNLQAHVNTCVADWHISFNLKLRPPRCVYNN